MAYATKCDRCGRYFDWHEEINGFAFLSYDRTKDRYLIDRANYDLCPGYVKSLRIWLEQFGKR